MKDSTHTEHTDVVIIGAGISGLAAAHFLKSKGHSVFLLEKKQRVGGVIRSERHNGFLVEYGPNSSLDTHPVVHQLFEELGIHEALIYANDKANNRYI
ncbi:MAG: FAD-dependent oxidoreductase, partial [Methanobacteriota archaeon]